MTISKSRKIAGMVMIARIWDISVMPEAVVVSFPYAAGITIVFNPRGIANEAAAQITNVLGRGIRAAKPMNNKG